MPDAGARSMSTQTTPRITDELQGLLSHATRQRLQEAYTMGDHCSLEYSSKGKHRTVTEYRTLPLSTMRVFTAHTGSVFEDGILFMEQAILTAIFLILALLGTLVYHLSDQYGWGLNHAIKGQEASIRAFAAMMTTLAVFMVTFYLAKIVDRWWTIRTKGIGAMKGATMELSLFLSQLVTQDEQILTAVRRYARASLQLIYLWRHNKLKNKEEMHDQLCKQPGAPLTEEEVEKLIETGTNLPEAVWTWNVSIIKLLHDQGAIKSDQLFNYLLEQCAAARTGIQCISTHITVQMPLPYTHLLTLMVKIHNVVLAVLLGILFGYAAEDGQPIVCIQLFGRTILMPVLFNSILLIAAQLHDPFAGGMCSFPAHKYSAAFERDGKSFIQAGKHMPPWLLQKMKEGGSKV